MGKIISSDRFPSQKADCTTKPIIYCCPSAAIAAEAISINRQLAEKLIQYAPQERTLRLRQYLSDTIASLPPRPLIKDFTVLFNPAYEVDALKVIIDVCKQIQFSLIWPGRLVENKLVYAEEGYRDFHEYPIDDYDIICIA